MADPDAVKPLTVVGVQNDCADAVGAFTEPIVTATKVLELSQVPTVCEA